MRNLLAILVLFFIASSIYAQDTIYKKDGTEIQAKVIEITDETVRYQEYNNLDGPVRNLLLSEVFMVVYEKGTREVIKSGGQAVSSLPDTESGLKTADIQIEVEDKRTNPFVYGVVLSRGILITGTKHKLKDKKNTVFPVVASIFKGRLKEKNLHTLSSENSAFKLQIDIDNLFLDIKDQFTYIQISTQCAVTVSISDQNHIMYQTKLSSDYSGKKNEVMSYLKQNGYASGLQNRSKPNLFLISIDDIIKQLINDQAFQKYYSTR